MTNYIMALFGSLDYTSIFWLMAIESSFIPFPSEVVIPPAAYLAAQGRMDIFLVVLFGTLGSVFGALINYFLAYTLGRKVIYLLANHRLAKWLLISPAKIEKAEKYFLKKGSLSTFVGRLITVVRQLISIPAGLAKMRLDKFILFTFLGAGLWCSVLAALGYFFGTNRELLKRYDWEFSLVLLLLLSLAYLFYRRRKQEKT